MDNHVLEGKVLALLDLTGGVHDFAFLCTAFSGEQPGELAIAVLRLCEAGKLQAFVLPRIPASLRFRSCLGMSPSAKMRSSLFPKMQKRKSSFR